MVFEEEVLVSIILPVFNGQDFMEMAILSIYEQSYTNWELIIIDDCSIDNTAVIAEKYSVKDKRIRYFKNVENLKLPASLNVGHKMAKGTYMTWTSHDNILKYDFLEKLVKTIVEKQADLVYANFDKIDQEGQFIKEIIPKAPFNLVYGSIIGAAFLYKKSLYERLNGYNEKLFLAEDYDFWLRCYLNFNLVKLNKNLYSYRVHRTSLTSKRTENTLYREQFNKSLRTIFKTIGGRLYWDDLSIEFFYGLHVHSRNSFQIFLEHHKIILDDLKKFEVKYKSDCNRLELWARLRSNWFNKPEYMNLSVLKTVIFNFSPMLFNKGLSKKLTSKLIFKCINPFKIV